MLRDKCIVLGVTGGIAAYKAADLASKLAGNGALVHVIMTRSATELVNPATFLALTRNTVLTGLFDYNPGCPIPHIDLMSKADLMVIAPATANMIGKLANGIADDLLSTAALAARCPVVVCPAMNVRMYANRAVVNNISRIKEYGYQVLEPAVGRMACGDTGRGRLPETGEIIGFIKSVLSKKDLAGLTVLVTAGGTREPIDPVRFISNRSSGKMGYALAGAAARRGARVILVSGQTALEAPCGVEQVSINTAREMYDAVMRFYPQADIVIKAAAVADYRPGQAETRKIKKKDQDQLKLDLVRNPDILACLGRSKRQGITLVGFAAETDNVVENARKKLVEKNLDLLVANDVSRPGAGFGEDTNIVDLFFSDGRQESWNMMEKGEVAEGILDAVLKIRQADPNR